MEGDWDGLKEASGRRLESPGGIWGACGKRLQACQLADSGCFFPGRSVCVSAFVCLPLGTIFDAFFVDLGFSWVPRGHIKYTWNLKMITSGPHLAGAGPRDRFLVNMACILGSILETFLHTGGHSWYLFASFRYPFCGDFF